MIRSYPMKGTIDAALPDAEARLLEDYKERCEHYTIVDLIRNDLNRIADRVRVERFRYVEKIATLRGEILQTSSEIAGACGRDGGRNWATCFSACCLPARFGAPEPATLRLIRDAEQCPRGYYTGVFGYFDGRDLDSAVMIRYIECENGRFYFRSGGGITVHSAPPAGVRRGRYQNLPADSLIAMDELLFIETIRVEDGTSFVPNFICSVCGRRSAKRTASPPVSIWRMVRFRFSIGRER